MRLRHTAFFLRRNLRRRPGRTLTVVGTIAVGIAVFHLTSALALALRDEVLGKIEAIFPERSVVVRARSLEIGPLAFSPRLLTSRITPGVVRDLAGMSEVESVWPVLPLTFPAMAVGRLAGYEGSTDVIVFGVPRQLVEPDIEASRGFGYADPRTSTVPVIVPRYFVDVFNYGMAESQGLPKLTDSAVIGRHFQLVLGVSILMADQQPGKVRQVRCEIVGLTRNPDLLGVVVPIEYVRRFNRWYHGAGLKEQYCQVHVVLRSPDDYESFAEKIGRMGLRAEGRRDMARRLRLAVNGAAVILVLFGCAILGLVVLNIVNTFALTMLERRSEVGLMRAVGASRKAAMVLFLAESSFVGLAGGLVGSGAAWTLALLVNHAARRWLPPFSLAPDYWLDSRAPLFVFCVLLATFGSAAATAPLLWRSIGRWPAELLRDR